MEFQGRLVVVDVDVDVESNLLAGILKILAEDLHCSLVVF
jgi:hypothetical protein